MEHTELTQSARMETELVRDRKVLSIREVVSRVGLSRSTIYEMIRRGEFPAPIELGPNRVGWLSDEIDAWLATRPRRRAPDHG